MEEKNNADTKQKKLFLLLRILGLITSICGLISFAFLASDFSNQTYVSENALLPGSAASNVDYKTVEEAVALTAEFAQFREDLHSRGANLSEFSEQSAQWVADKLNSFGAEAWLQPFDEQEASLRAAWLLSNHSRELASMKSVRDFSRLSWPRGVNVYSVQRAGRADGTESLVFSAKLPSFDLSQKQVFQSGDVSTVCLCIALFRAIARNKWLSKNLVFVALDGTHPSALRSWLDAYLGASDERTSASSNFARAGTILAAMHIDGGARDNVKQFNALCVETEGANGRLPNLDMVNVVVRVAGRAGAFSGVQLTCSNDPLYDLHLMPHLLSLFSLKSLPKAVHNFYNFMLNQASGEPTNEHGHFSLHNINALTLSARTLKRASSQSFRVRHFAMMIEGTLRSFNNLIEHLHQSFWYYILPSTSRYVSIGDYMIPFGAILAPPGILIALDLIRIGSDASGSTRAQAGLAFIRFATLQTAAVAAFALPFFWTYPSALPLQESGDLYMSSWWLLLLSVLFAFALLSPSVLFALSPLTESSSRLFFTFCAVPSLAFLGCLSLLNFSFCALASALLFGPLYCVCLPSGSTRRTSLGSFGFSVFQLLLALVLNPYALIYYASHWTSTPFLTIFAASVTRFRSFGSLLYPFMLLAYFPLSCAAISVSWRRVKLRNLPTEKEKDE